MAQLCPRCGAHLPDEGWQGLCPRCVIGTSFRPEDEPSPGDPAAGPSSASPPREVFPGQQLGDYEWIEELGRGGMGVVYRARQRSLGRDVAIKTLLAGPLADARTLQRFRAEAAVLAGLRHPHIVAIYECGHLAGRPYFVMEYVPGGTLADRVRERPLAPELAASCLRKIALAVQHAHDHGILHRDLKPSNVLIDENGEPKVMDFGLAKRVEGSEAIVEEPSSRQTFEVRNQPSAIDQRPGTTAIPDLTLNGQLLGSPHYLPPEQLSARRGGLGPASDVYSLGGILYHLLTGRPPFLAATLEQTLLQVIDTEAPSPRQLNPEVPRDLETICLKCLAKEPACRYGAPRELADELARVLADEPIRARPIGRVERVARWSRRHPGVAVLGTSLLVVLLAVALGASWAAVRFKAARESEQQARLRAEAGERLARENAYAADMNLAYLALEAGHPTHASHLLDRYLPAPPANSILQAQSDLRGWEWHYLRRQSRGGEFATLATPATSPAGVSTLAFTLDGARLVSGNFEGTLQLWDVAQRRLLATGHVTEDIASAFRAGRGHPRSIDRLAFTPDGRRLAGSLRAGSIQLWDALTLAPLGPPLPHPLSIRALHFEADQRTLNAWDGEGHTRWDTSDGRKLSRRELDLGWNIVRSPDGTLLADGRSQGRAQLLDATTGVSLLQWRCGPSGQPHVLFSSDGRWLVSSGGNGVVVLVDVVGRKIHREFPAHPSGIRAHVFTPDGQWLATAGADSFIKLWNTHDWRETAALQGHRAGVDALAISPDGRTLASGDTAGRIKLWTIPPAPPPSNHIVFSPPLDPYLRRFYAEAAKFGFPAIASTNPLLSAIDSLGRGLRSLPALDHPTLSPDAKLLAGVVDSRVIRFWDVVTLKDQGRLVSDAEKVQQSDFSPDQRWLLSRVERPAAFVLWNLATRQREAQWPCYPVDGTTLPIFSPDGTRFIVGYADGMVEMCALQPPRRLALWKAEPVFVKSIVFSHDGRRVATGGRSGVAKLWDLPAGRLLAVFHCTIGELGGLAFSPDDHRLAVGASVASGSTKNVISFWDVRTHHQLLTLRGHLGASISALAFTADGYQLFSVSGQDLRRWDATPVEEK